MTPAPHPHASIKALLDAASAKTMSSATEALALADEAVLALAGLGGRATPAQQARVLRTRASRCTTAGAAPKVWPS